MKWKTILVLIDFFIFNVLSVHITSLAVPSTYVLDENFCRPLILDCDYEFRANDVGFVLKWYHNSHLIYQWIPPKPARIFSLLKYHINTSFIIIDNPKYKYRAIQLQPHYNLTGNWMCSVQTYHTRDRSIKKLQMIVPEISFELYHHDLNFYVEDSRVFLVICNVKNIFPEPELSIVIDHSFKVTSEMKSEYDENGWNKSIMARIDKNFIQSPSAINCILEINGTDYIKKKQFIYYDQEFDKKYPRIERHSMESSGVVHQSCSLALASFVIIFFTT